MKFHLPSQKKKKKKKKEIAEKLSPLIIQLTTLSQISNVANRVIIEYFLNDVTIFLILKTIFISLMTH